MARQFIQTALERPGARGGLHRSTHTPMGQKIPAKKLAGARAGRYGKKAKKQAQFAAILARMRKH